MTVVVSDLEDAYVASDHPTANYGTAGELLVDADPAVYRTFIRSPGLGGMPPGATVRSAVLALHCYDEGGELRIARVLGAWTQDAVTWDTAPSFDTGFLSVAEVPEGPLAIDVTSFVQAWANGTANHGVVLYTLAAAAFGGSDYCSLESTRAECAEAAARPTLTIEWQ